MKNIKSPMETTEKPYLEIYEDCKDDEEVLSYLDKLGRNKTKVPFRKSDKTLTSKINHTNAETYLNLAYNMPTKGKVSRVDNHMTDIMKHDYLRKSMEQRVERKALYQSFVESCKRTKKFSGRETNASYLRSISTLGSEHPSSKAYLNLPSEK
jgi:hypothetical protein